MEEKTADQGGPEGENPDEKGVEGEPPGDGDKEGNSLMTLVRRNLMKLRLSSHPRRTETLRLSN